MLSLYNRSKWEYTYKTILIALLHSKCSYQKKEELNNVPQAVRIYGHFTTAEYVNSAFEIFYRKIVHMPFFF